MDLQDTALEELREKDEQLSAVMGQALNLQDQVNSLTVQLMSKSKMATDLQNRLEAIEAEKKVSYPLFDNDGQRLAYARALIGVLYGLITERKLTYEIGYAFMARIDRFLKEDSDATYTEGQDNQEEHEGDLRKKGG